MDGHFSNVYESWRKELLSCLSHIEAVIDFAEDEDDVGEDKICEDVAQRLNVLLCDIQRVLHDNRKGELLREGVKVALIGPPNR